MLILDYWHFWIKDESVDWVNIFLIINKSPLKNVKKMWTKKINTDSFWHYIIKFFRGADFALSKIDYIRE